MPRHIDRELNKLKQRILALGAMVEERLRMASKAIETRNLFDADQIVKTDFEIDHEEVEIEEECLKILALNQPVATDLRFLVITIKINNDLERIADEAVNIARKLKTIIKNSNGCSVIYDYSVMVDKCRNMLSKSLDALVGLDLDIAFKVLLLDDDVDRIHNQMYVRMIEDMKTHPDCAEYLVNMYWLSRHLERIADHATNIAEEIIYLIEGEIVRHKKY